jgi:hypothetical protein
MIDSLTKFLKLASVKTAQYPKLIFGGDINFNFRDVQVFGVKNMWEVLAATHY